MTIYQAPAVCYPTGRSTRLALVLVGVLLLGALTAGVYGYLTYSKSNVLFWQNGVIAASWLLAAACVWQFLNQLQAGVLGWDGISWHWSAAVAQAKDEQSELAEPVGQAEHEGMISVRFDGQRCMLIKLEPPLGLSRWLWLEQGCAPQRWHDVRRAVYSPANAPVFNTSSK
ncbi:MAG: hypothetical protein Q7T07_11480 [Burkholderiaceae bacterium]|nr:hypothetical protein [Burkholderiaceae bacterium]